MDDEDVQVTSDDAGDEGGDAQVAGLPPYVDGIIEGYSKQFGRVVGRKLVRAKDPTKDRDRLVVTYESGQGKRKAVTFKIGKEGTPADPTDPTDTGTPAETTIVESVEDAKAPAKPAARQQVVRGPDGKNHIMEADATGAYTIDRGLAANQPTPEKKPPSEATKWQPLKTPDGKVVALVDPSTGDTVSVTQKDPKDPQVFQTKDGRVITVSPDGRTAKDVTPEGPGDKTIPANAPKYVPNYDTDDGGLTDYSEQLMEARRAGIINREQGLRLLQQAGAIWETTAAHGGKRRDQANTTRANDITQRGQTVDEVASRRTSADGQFKDVNGTISKYGATLIPEPGSGQSVVDAYRSMLNMARDHVDAAGGYRDVPEVGTPGILQQAPGTESTQVVMHPGGRIEVSPAGAPPPSAVGAVGAGVTATTQAAADPTGPNVQAATDATMQGSQAAFGAAGVPAAAPPPPVNPPAGEAGNDPTKPVGLFRPDDQVESLVAMGFDPQEAQNVVALYKRGVREDHL